MRFGIGDAFVFGVFTAGICFICYFIISCSFKVYKSIERMEKNTIAIEKLLKESK